MSEIALQSLRRSLAAAQAMAESLRVEHAAAGRHDLTSTMAGMSLSLSGEIAIVDRLLAAATDEVERGYGTFPMFETPAPAPSLPRRRDTQ